MMCVRAVVLTAMALGALCGAPGAEAAPRRGETGEPAPRLSEMGGRYAVLRESGKDTGCMITFDDHQRVATGNRASLAPACRDQGIVVFDPTSWHVNGNKLVLTAKKGHTAVFEMQPGGTWQKEGEGKPLGLKKF